MTEQQEYRVLEAHGDIELREYAPCVVADVVVPGSTEQAASAAFRPLFQCISGDNHGAEPSAQRRLWFPHPMAWPLTTGSHGAEVASWT